MTNDFPDTTDIVDYPDVPGHNKRSRFSSVLRKAAALVLPVALFGGGVLLGKIIATPDTRTANSSEHAKAVFQDICADNNEAVQARSKLVYTDPRYLAAKPASQSENPDQHWCVFGTSYESELWWGMAYIGEDNPIYRSMFAGNGYDDHASRAVITYQGVPPLKFARDGWVAFVTPSGSGGEETWSDFKAGAGAMLLLDIAKHADS